VSVDVTSSDPIVYAFGEFRLDASKRLIFGPNGEMVPLMPKAYEILAYLVGNSGRVIDKDELLSAIWPDTAVEENNLTQNISAIRRVLGEKHRENRFIATVPGRGYKFVAPVTVVDNAPAVTVDPNVENFRKQRPDVPQVEAPTTSRIWLAIGAAVIIIGVAGAGIFIWKHPNDQPGTRINSLAVLPFKPLVADNRDEAFEMGITDTLIRKLSGDELDVRPLASVRRFASPEQNAADAGRQLGVAAVLDGAIVVVGDRVRVSAELIRVRDGRRLWNGQFDEKLTDIFAMQDSISARVASALRVPLADRGRKSYTDNVEAYQLYMKGDLHAKRLILPELQKGISYYEQAIAADPAYALAYVGLANAYRAMVLTNDFPPNEMMPKAQIAAVKAVEIDPGLAEAWTALANSDFWYDWNWKAAEEHFRRGLELDPRSPITHALYAHLLSNLGRHEEAVNEIKRALELDPPSPLLNAMQGQILCFAGRLDESTQILRSAIDLDPNFWLAHLFISRNYIVEANWTSAIESATKAKEITNGNSEATSNIGFALAKSGKIGEARKILLDLESRSNSHYISQYARAQLYLGLGDQQKALDALERAYDQRDSLMVFLKVEPKWNQLRSEPRFAALVKRMNFE